MVAPSSNCEHELVSSSLTTATVPLLVLTRRRSQSLTNEIYDNGEEKRSISDRLSSCKSNSVNSLNCGRIPFADPKWHHDVPRIIVISPTSESSLMKHDSVCSEDSTEASESNVFVSLNFSTEVFEAVEFMSWPVWDLCFTNLLHKCHKMCCNFTAKQALH